MKTKCVWCGGKSKNGVHDNCWKQLKGFMLDNRLVNQKPLGESSDNWQPTGQSYITSAGQTVSQGRVMPSVMSDNLKYD